MEKSIDQKKEKEKTKESNSDANQANLSETLKEFLLALEKSPQIEEKLKKTLEFMRHSLSQKGSPRFRDFWEAKKICLPLFKEKMSHALKEELWTQYIELSSEAKNLKSILDEQSSFSVEQIELALKAISNDLESHEQLSKNIKLAFPETKIPALSSHMSFYQNSQRQIMFYVTLSARTKDLRKEILLTEMRVKDKNKLLANLSKIADGFLPKKKSLIKEVSDTFVGDVMTFAKKHFDLEKKEFQSSKIPLFKLRDEIKALQAFAKSLSLNSHSFSESRLVLSNCWEILKEEGKILREKHVQKQKDIEGKTAEFQEKIRLAKEAFDENNPKTKEEVLKKSEELFKALKEEKFYRNELTLLKKQIAEFEEKYSKPFLDVEEKLKEKEKLASQEKKLKAAAFKEKYLETIASSGSLSLRELKDLFETFQKDRKTHRFDFSEKLKISELGRELYELILLKEEDDLNLEVDLEEIQQLFSRWETFREETRKRLENYRKEMGGSGFDFEKAMLYREYMDLEKARLDRAVEKIELLEAYI